MGVEVIVSSPYSDIFLFLDLFKKLKRWLVRIIVVPLEEGDDMTSCSLTNMRN